MDISRALAQVAEIHEQMAKGEVYRGYRSVPLAASGLIGIGAAVVQPRALGSTDPVGFVIYWTAVACCAGFVGISEIVFNYCVHDNQAARRRTRRCLVAAGVRNSRSGIHFRISSATVNFNAAKTISSV